MRALVINRLLTLILVWLGVITLVFLMRLVIPGDPVESLLYGRPRTPETEASIKHYLGLDKPLYEQYLNYIWNALHGDLGKSFSSQRNVTEEIADRYINTLLIAIGSSIVAVVLGLVLGAIAAKYRGTSTDIIVSIASLIGLSLSPIWLGLIFMNFLGVKLGWLQAVGQTDLRQMIMPCLTLGIVFGGALTRFVRSSIVDVLGQAYIITATAKGLDEWQVLTRHAFRNALIPVITKVGLLFGSFLGGAVLTETVFAWPGLGQLTVKAIQERDYPIVQGVILLTATTYVLINILVDLVYGLIDPRIRELQE